MAMPFSMRVPSSTQRRARRAQMLFRDCQALDPPPYEVPFDDRHGVKIPTRPAPAFSKLDHTHIFYHAITKKRIHL